eukprot:801288_1
MTPSVTNESDLKLAKQISLISGYFRRTISTILDPKVIYHLIQNYYRRPLLSEIIIQQLNKLYNTQLSRQFSAFIQHSQWTCIQIYKDITIKNLQSKIVNQLSSDVDVLDRYKLHDQLRGMCYGRKASKFNENASRYLYYFESLTIDYMKSDGTCGRKIDLNIDVDNSEMVYKLAVLVFLYLFAYNWMYVNVKKKKK